jgi:hypothetical protein
MAMGEIGFDHVAAIPVPGEKSSREIDADVAMADLQGRAATCYGALWTLQRFSGQLGFR